MSLNSIDHTTMSHALFIALFLLSPLLLLLLLGIIRAKTDNPNLPPSPPKLPIVGNLHQLGSLPHHSLRDLSNKYGPLMLLQLGQIPTLVVSSHQMAEEIMKTHDLIFANRPPSKVASHILRGSDDIAFAPYGEYWSRARKLCVTHLLSTKMVESLRHAKEKEVELMIEKISNTSSTAGTVNMSGILSCFASNVLSSSISANTSTNESRKDMLFFLAEENSTLLGSFHVADFFPILGWVNFFGLDARGKQIGKRWDDILDEIIKEHANGSSKDNVGHKNTSFVDVLLALENDSINDFPFTRENIKAILINMFAAGVDTSFTVLEWTMAELVQNPKVMKKLQHEVRSVAHGKFLIREEDLSEMSYLKAVIKEAMRLHTPVPLLLPRESSDNCQLGGYHVPKKTRVIINAWAIARDPTVWEEPDEFKPERFISSSVDFKGNDFKFIPFGAGRRICPGMNFAIQTMELALANLVNRFDWELPSNMRSDDLDMNEKYGLVTRKKQRLDLVAKLFASQ